MDVAKVEIGQSPLKFRINDPGPQELHLSRCVLDLQPDHPLKWNCDIIKNFFSSFYKISIF